MSRHIQSFSVGNVSGKRDAVCVFSLYGMPVKPLNSMQSLVCKIKFTAADCRSLGCSVASEYKSKQTCPFRMPPISSLPCPAHVYLIWLQSARVATRIPISSSKICLTFIYIYLCFLLHERDNLPRCIIWPDLQYLFKINGTFKRDTNLLGSEANDIANDIATDSFDGTPARSSKSGQMFEGCV